MLEMEIIDEHPKLNVHQRISEVMKKVSYIKKRKGAMPYSAVSHDDVTAKVRPFLIEFGLTMLPYKYEFQGNDSKMIIIGIVRITNIDDPTDFVDVPSIGIGKDSQDKAAGKAISYLTKYAILKTFNLETGDENDPDMAPPPKDKEEFDAKEKSRIVGVLRKSAPDKLEKYGPPDKWSIKKWRGASKFVFELIKNNTEEEEN